MTTAFPAAKDNFTNPAPKDAQNATPRSHSEMHGDLNDAVEALQTKVGIDGSTDPDSMDYKAAYGSFAPLVTTVTAGQTLVPLGGLVGRLVGAVYVNGLLQNPSTYTVGSGSITFTSGLSAGTLVAMAANGPFAGRSLGGMAYTAALTGAISVALIDILAETASITSFGAIGNGINDDGLALQAAINAVAARGGGIVWVPEGTFQVNTPVAGATGVIVKGQGAKSKLRIGALTYCFNTAGTLSSDTTNTLASNAAVSTQTLVLAAGKGANFAVGDYALLTSEAAMPIGSCTNKRGEWVRIQAIAGDTITTESPVIYTYNTVDTARLRKITPVLDFAIEDITIDGDYDANSATFRRSQTVFQWCVRPRVSRVRFRDMGQQAVIFGGCINGIMEGCQADDLESDDAAQFGYFLLEVGPCHANRMTNCTGERVRHMFTTTDASTPYSPGYGQPVGTRIIGCTALWPRAAGFDTHEPGLDIAFSGCTVVGGQRCGFQLRAMRNSVTDCVVQDCVGEAVYIDSSAQDAVVKNNRFIRTNTGTYLSASRVDRGAVFDNGIRSCVQGNRFELCGGPAIEAYTGATGFDYSANLIRNPAQITATNKFGIYVNTGTAAIDVDIHHNRITCTDGKTTTGINVPNAQTVGFVTGNNVRGVTTAYSLASAIQHTGNLPAGLISVGQPVTVTIASDTIDLTNINSSMILLAGEGGAADNLVTINGGMSGVMYLFRRATGVNITFKATGGNIFCAASTDKVLGGSFDTIMAYKAGNNWIVDFFADV